MNSREINDVKKVFNDSYQKTDQQWLKSYILEITEEEKYLEQLLLNLGFGNSVVAQKVVAIFSPGSSPMKRVRNEAKKENCLFDVTHGRKTRSVIITECNHVILSSVKAETVSRRFASLLEEKSRKRND